MKQKDAVSSLVDEIEAAIPPKPKKRCSVCVLGPDVHIALVTLNDRGTSFRRLAAGINARFKLTISEGSVQNHLQKHRDYL